MSEAIKKAMDGARLTPEDALALYRECQLPDLGALADFCRARKKAAQYDGRGDRVVTYIVDRNINYTNICDVYCTFCAFYRTETEPDAYVLSHEQIDRKIEELISLGGTQILMQGGHHPKLGIDFYLDLLRHIKSKFPQINIHAFSPPEFNHFSRVFGMALKEVVSKFKEAGLGSIPGGGGEILVDRVRQRISPLKCNSDQWLRVMEIAHGLGMRTTATMMFGHVETIEERIEHLRRLRELQDRTGGFTAFICWTFQPENTRLVVPQIAGAHEYLRMQAIARVFLDNFDNVQSSWVTQGPQIGQIALQFGANDFGSIMVEENVVSSAGTTFRLGVGEMRRMISELGYEPHQRDNWYRLLN